MTKLQKAAEKKKIKGEKLKMDILVRNVSEGDILKLDDLARENNLSRNEFVKRLISSAVCSPEMKALDDKYEKLVDKALAAVKDGRQVLERNEQFFKEVAKKL